MGPLKFLRQIKLLVWDISMLILGMALILWRTGVLCMFWLGSVLFHLLPWPLRPLPPFWRSCLGAGCPDSCTDKVGRLKCPSGQWAPELKICQGCTSNEELWDIFQNALQIYGYGKPNANVLPLIKIFKLRQPLSCLSLMSSGLQFF